ncbi:FkbM family methyltransferase [Lacihabitans lacunae]|uniref:FkbM family methyltransferase n=1 Tax=Lacihabitans lacunae TaxID=1028214 RepID=A0ABV7Z201_9BACT
MFRKLTKFVIRKVKEFGLFFVSKEQNYLTKFGFAMNLNLKNQVDREIYLDYFELDSQFFFNSIIEKNMIVFDIGANIGLYSLIALQKMENSGFVHSFEPAPNAYSKLTQNINLNKFKNVKVNQMGVSSSTGELLFNLCEDDAYNSIGEKPLQKIREVIKIKSTTINNYCKENNISKIDVIKIDTEGAELLVLEGGGDLLSHENGPIILCEFNKNSNYGFGHSIESYQEILNGYSYQLFILENFFLKQFDLETYNGSEIICLKGNHIKMLKDKFEK